MLVEPSDHFQVVAGHSIVHCLRGASFDSVVMHPLDQIEVIDSSTIIHSFHFFSSVLMQPLHHLTTLVSSRDTSMISFVDERITSRHHLHDERHHRVHHSQHSRRIIQYSHRKSHQRAHSIPHHYRSILKRQLERPEVTVAGSAQGRTFIKVYPRHGDI